MRFKVGQAEVRGGKEEVGAERPDDVLKGDASFEDIAHVALDAHCLNAIGLGEMALTVHIYEEDAPTKHGKLSPDCHGRGCLC